MKVDTEDPSAQWTKSLSIRIQLPLDYEDHEHDFDTSDESSAAKSPSSVPRLKGRFWISKASLMALRNLPVESPLVLFTPLLKPAGINNGTRDSAQQRDPFETFGRQLASHHPNISHVPYIPSVGFTTTHLHFLMEGEAVITLVCEPNHAVKKRSMSEQHAFAEAALKAYASVAQAGLGEFVLVQCGTDGSPRRPQSTFVNVVETESYDDETAVALANSILGRG